MDKSAAGKGKLACVIETPSGEVLDSDVTEKDGGNVQVFFTPQELGEHKVKLFFGGEELPGSPMVINVSLRSLKF